MSTEFSAKDIKVLNGMEAIRQRPHMYLGDLASPELNTRLFMQSFCHAVDDVIDERCTQISVLIGKNKGVISYNSGMPLKSDSSTGDQPIAMMFLCVHSACHSRKKHIDVGSEFCELGLSVLNAMCADLFVEIRDEGLRTSFHFQNGILLHPIELGTTQESDYTRISLQLDSTILCDDFLDIEKISSESELISKKYSVPIDVGELR